MWDYFIYKQMRTDANAVSQMENNPALPKPLQLPLQLLYSLRSL